MSKQAKVANFTQNEIAALLAYDQTALFDAIKYLAANANLRLGHDVRFVQAANKLTVGERLTKDEKHYFLRMTPYDGVMFITLYHKQMTEFLTEKYSNQREKIATLPIPERMLENRKARWARQGQELNDAKNGVGGRLRYDITNEASKLYAADGQKNISVKADTVNKIKYIAAKLEILSKSNEQ